MKRCTRCGKVKPLDAFNKRSAVSDGRQSQCRECAREKWQRYQAVHGDEIRERSRRHYQENLDESRERNRDSNRRYRAAHLEERREVNLRWYRDNRELSIERMQQWREANQDEIREKQRKYRNTIRTIVFSYYGWSCACCGSAKRLNIDHVNGDGRQHRAETGIGQRGGTRMYLWLITNGLPAGFQTLCFPCNRSKANGTHCRLDHGVTS